MTSVAFPTKKIEDFCRTGSGGTPSRSKPEYFDGGAIPWVKSGELKTRFVSSTEESITDAAVEQSAAKLVPKGALLIAMYGATVGEVSELAMDATTNQAICHIVPDPNLCDRGYLYQYLSAIKPELLDRRVGGGQPNISQAIIKSLSVPLPPLPEQRRIAAILDKADALRAKRREAITKLDQLLQSVFLEMFGDPSRNNFGWRVLPLGELLADGPQNGLYKPAGDYGSGTPILRIDSFRAGDVIEISPEKRVRLDISDIEKYGLRPGDLVINRVNSPEHLGKPALINRVLEPTVFESNMMRMSVSKELIRPKYLLKYLVQQFVRDQIARQRKDSINQSSINQGDVMGLMINVPPIELQKKFEAFSEKLATQRSSSVEGERLLSSSFESLQKLAFSGNL